MPVKIFMGNESYKFSKIQGDIMKIPRHIDQVDIQPALSGVLSNDLLAGDTRTWPSKGKIITMNHGDFRRIRSPRSIIHRTLSPFPRFKAVAMAFGIVTRSCPLFSYIVYSIMNLGSHAGIKRLLKGIGTGDLGCFRL